MPFTISNSIAEGCQVIIDRLGWAQLFRYPDLKTICSPVLEADPAAFHGAIPVFLASYMVLDLFMIRVLVQELLDEAFIAPVRS